MYNVIAGRPGSRLIGQGLRFVWAEIYLTGAQIYIRRNIYNVIAGSPGLRVQRFKGQGLLFVWY